MLNHLSDYQLLYLDIETVSAYPSYFDMPERIRLLWDKKAKTLNYKGDQKPMDLFNRSGIYAEFGKIVCISVGYVVKSSHRLRIKSYYSDDESKLLYEFGELLNQHFNSPKHLMVAHNGKEFDFPYIARRMLVNGLELPSLLDIAGKKPWEIRHIDTLELWKFGDYKHFTSLDLLTAIFDIPSPKADINGSQVNEVYWKENNLKRIAEYCQNDVLAIVQLLNRYRGQNLFLEENIEFVALEEIE
ncbi:3'-5' exonuclease [Lentimicrobium sp. S6]|uniref:3'-5' exonuclease n=1 Tax=Lentimicrobium sp. S6 TaxID=2735872 RepID=UPI00155197CF|nr:3'-5' exonuclease [Lentimicrobium sp. S6]NPD44029.1 3'-5' exonuclease [Lentimicrobium sp. S6]